MTAPNPPFSIAASYLGPVFSLKADLSKNAQNLIFARNGTGKSFLSRAFRYLDKYGAEKDIGDAAVNLVSDEAELGAGLFEFSRGAKNLGKLSLDRHSNSVTAEVQEAIFHVFSEDFVHEELRDRNFVVDGRIEHQIAIDSDTINFKDEEDNLSAAVETENNLFEALQQRFLNARETELVGKVGVNKKLKDYTELTLEALLDKHAQCPVSPEKPLADIIADLDKLKSLPSDPVLPETVNAISLDEINIEKLEDVLLRVTSPSSVSEKIRRKIEEHHQFVKLGVEMYESAGSDGCPFCEQKVTDPAPKSVIEEYITYFQDLEAQHREELRSNLGLLERVEAKLTDYEVSLARQVTRFSSLSLLVPSQKDVELNDGVEQLNLVRAEISSLRTAVEEKLTSLNQSRAIPENSLLAFIQQLNIIVSSNNDRVAALSRSITRSDSERKALNRLACSAFATEFVIKNWSKIAELKQARLDATEKRSALAALELSLPSADARERVAVSFEMLLREFFGSKYIFDKERFVLKRGNFEIVRGPHRTLSDGEKTAIAFCYFLASIHMKVKSNTDYRRLFLVFDDPVTSMSFDFIFTIAQCLKNLSISNQGELSIVPGKSNGHNVLRPNLLVLTHSAYFFNINRTNSVVKVDSTYVLSTDGEKHNLSRMNNYVSPFEQQLEHVYKIAKGAEPDHGTANAVRSVLEAVGRFCRPDKTQSVQDFISFVAAEENIRIQSVLINSLCHGTYFEEAPVPDDLKLACEEAIAVVEKYANGQLLLLQDK